MSTGYMSEKTETDVLVIGGGAAGIMAAYQAARSGARVGLLERNEKLGKKLYITGKGRCNATNTADLEEFLKQVPRNPRFLYSALRSFDHSSLVELLENNGTRMKVERGGRVFPVSDHASDVTRALTHCLQNSGVAVFLNCRVNDVIKSEESWLLKTEDKRLFTSSALIIATGGMSYPATGSTGDGYSFCAQMGHYITPLRGSLVGFESAEDWPKLLQGLTLKNVRVSARINHKIVYNEMGEMLFTHFGFSGPLFIEMSSHLPDEWSTPEIRLDLKPGMTEEEVDARLIRELTANPRRQLGSILSDWLPSRMAPVFTRLCGLEPTKLASSITRAERIKLKNGFKALAIETCGLRPVEEAIVTRGGVDTREVIPQTMMSRLNPGLFLAGELLDVDAHTGGFNLQIAFSTGALAGKNAALYALSNRKE